MDFRRPTEEAYAELQTAYDFYNDNLFADGARLPACMITFQREKRTMGYFSKARFVRRDGIQTDEIAMNPDYFAVIPLVEILQTLVHEMVHLWQAHFGTPSRAGYHNREWARKMEHIGLMPSDTGCPGGKKVGQSMNDYVIAGGRFEVATKRLLKRGFAISWMDRFPVPYQSPFQQLSSMLADAAIEADLVESADDSHGEFATAFAVPPAAGLGIAARPEGDRSNRLK